MKKLKAKKELGQHFLKHEPTLNSIVGISQVDSNATVLEIGGGMGDLSRLLAPKCKKLIVVETDDDMFPYLNIALEQYDNVHILHEDVLKLNLYELLKDESPFQVVANLPYYLTSEIMERLFLLPMPIKSISVMVQKEAGERLCAQEGSKQRGPISLIASIRSESVQKIDVTRGKFTPPPNVDSVFLHFDMRSRPLVPYSELNKIMRFFNIAFSMRRKTLVNNLGSIADKKMLPEILISLGIKPNARAEELSTEQFIALAERLNITTN